MMLPDRYVFKDKHYPSPVICRYLLVGKVHEPCDETNGHLANIYSLFVWRKPCATWKI
jgi:hypothetical protein